ncbi:Ger(x)C family spore germination protein [Bacillus sp. FJAT-29814]|uniref:Ger(x)C family spore germination protein n=1 Tax=Bacillus sp. FJAT-29814 TaxID=1729688 RepID=UPI00083705A4|nr:Ger(x)C family spore germination protein [Bacillus sp. FJAT-29814]
MWKTSMRFVLFISLSVLLCGCWDQRLLKEQKLILLLGYDLNSKGEIVTSAAYPISKGKSGTSNAPAAPKSTILSTTGETAMDSLLHADLRISERIDISKAHVILFGEKAARKGIYPELDHIYRNPKGALSSKVAIIEGQAIDAVSINQEEADLNAQYYDEFLKSGIATGFYTNYNVQSVRPLLLHYTKDPLLPLLKLDRKHKRAVSAGMALFNNGKMTGKLSIPESKMYMVLSGEQKQKISFFVKSSHQIGKDRKNDVVVEILGGSQKTTVRAKNKSVSARISAKLQYRVTEYPKDKLTDPQVMSKLTHEIKTGLTKTAESMIAQLQMANCDGLGLEEELRVHHNKLWKDKYRNINLKEVPIKADLQFELVNSGIIN